MTHGKNGPKSKLEQKGERLIALLKQLPPAQRKRILARVRELRNRPAADDAVARAEGSAYVPAKPTREQEKEIIPVLAELLDAAMEEGATSFKAAARRAIADIEDALGQDLADLITLKHLQGAYISISSQYPDGAVDDPATVVSVKSKDELKEKGDVQHSGPGVEPDSPSGAEPDVASPDGNGPTTPGMGNGGNRRGPAGPQPRQPDGAGVYGAGAAVAGAPGDNDLFGAASTVPPGSARNAEDRRDAPDGRSAPSSGRFADQGAEKVAPKGSSAEIQRMNADRRANENATEKSRHFAEPPDIGGIAKWLLMVPAALAVTVLAWVGLTLLWNLTSSVNIVRQDDLISVALASFGINATAAGLGVVAGTLVAPSMRAKVAWALAGGSTLLAIWALGAFAARSSMHWGWHVWGTFAWVVGAAVAAVQMGRSK